MECHDGISDWIEELNSIKKKERDNGIKNGKKREYFKKGTWEYERKKYLKQEIKKYEDENYEFKSIKQQIADIKQQITNIESGSSMYDTTLGALFVRVSDIMNGISDLSWTKKVKHPSEFTQVGANIDVVVLEIDKENRRLSLGHKQLEENPWDTYETIYTPGSVHTGKITEMMDKGAVITLNEGGEGFATPKHLVKEDGTQAQLGEELEFKVIEFVKETKRIILSHSRTFETAKDEVKAPRKHNTAKKESTPVINNVAASTTLGDLDALAELKAKMEKGE